MRSTLSKSAVMQSAWSLFRSQYKFGLWSFKQIGRACFAWCLSEAWRRAREATRIAAIPVETKTARIEALKASLIAVDYLESYRHAQAERRAIEAEIRLLAA